MTGVLQFDKATVRSFLLAVVENLVASTLGDTLGPLLAAMAPTLRLRAERALVPAERRQRGRPRLESTGCAKLDRKRELARLRQASRRAALRDQRDNAGPGLATSEMSPGIVTHLARPPAPARAFSGISSLSVSSENPREIQEKPPSGISLPRLEGGGDKAELRYPTQAHTEEGPAMTQPGAITVDESVEVYMQAVRSVAGPQWEAEAPPREHAASVRGMVGGILKQLGTPDPVRNEATVRHNVRRFALAVQASNLVLKRFDADRCRAFLNAHGFERAPGPSTVRKAAPEPEAPASVHEALEAARAATTEPWLLEILERAAAGAANERQKRVSA